MLRSVGLIGVTPAAAPFAGGISPVPQTNASHSSGVLSKTSPGFIAALGLIRPDPALNGTVFAAPAICVALVIIADLIIMGDQSGCSCLSSAASPATCGLAIDVP